MSRLLELDENPVPVMDRIAGSVAVVSGILFVPLVVCSHGVVIEVFGKRWVDVSEIFPGLCLGMLVGGAYSTAVTGYLMASGDAKTPRNAILATLVVSLVVTLPLLRLIGAWGIGIGGGLGWLADTAVLVWRMRMTAGFSLRPIAIPALCALLAAGPFWLGVLVERPAVAYELAVGGASLALYAGLLGIFDRPALTQTCGLALRVGHAAVRRQAVSAS
jgi:O-antigen/teichoic acid export membrane protein